LVHPLLSIVCRTLAIGADLNVLGGIAIYLGDLNAMRCGSLSTCQANAPLAPGLDFKGAGIALSLFPSLADARR
jgi:hypothetical protein